LSSSTIAESNSPLVPAPPPSFIPPAIDDADLDQHVVIPHSFHTHATALFPYVNKDTKILSLVPGSRISVRSPMAQAPIFDLLAKSTKWLAIRGARQARELLKEVLERRTGGSGLTTSDRIQHTETTQPDGETLSPT
jgi:hypothetical protein